MEPLPAPPVHDPGGSRGLSPGAALAEAHRHGRAVLRLSRLGAHLLAGLFTTHWLFPRASEAQRAAHVQRWSAGVLRCLGVAWLIEGTVAATTRLVVANHVSWLDVMVIHSAAPRARFVAKAEVRRWPAAGRLAAAAGTLFVERRSRSSVRTAAPQLSAAFARGELIALFPEGTTTLGLSVLAFHSSLLQPAIDAAVPVQALGIRYSGSRGEPCRAAAYIDDDALLPSIWRLALESDVSVTLRVCPAVQAAGHRRGLASRLRDIVAAAVP